MTLNEGALGKANLFDLVHRTLRFTPEGTGYHVANGPLRWDSDFGPELTDATAKLQHVVFPFSGKKWDAFSVGANGSIAFGPVRGGGRSGGVSIGRFDQLQEAARNLVNATPSLCVFLKPRMSGRRYVKERGRTRDRSLSG
jgi:hypothetical protein